MTDHRGRLSGRRVIVTGGSKGIGRALTERFLDEGATVAVLSRDAEAATRAVSDLADRGTAYAVEVDVADPRSVEASVAESVAQLGGLDILVNNAALFGGIDHSDHSLEYLETVFRTNLLSLWIMTRATAGHLVESDHGRIVNLSSGSAYNYTYRGPTDEFPGLRSFSYGWTKYGVNGLTKYCATQLGAWGVTVNAIAPGPTQTEALERTTSAQIRESLADQQPIKGPIQPSDIAGAAAFLAGDDARFITGQILVVDGGRHMPG